MPLRPHALLLLAALSPAACAVHTPAPAPAASAPAAAVLSPEERRELALAYRQGLGGFFGGNLDRATAGFQRALALNPGDDSLLYTLGAVAAHAGRTEEAYGWLERLVAAKSRFVPREEDFPGLAGERFQRAVEALRANGLATHAEVAFTVPEKDLIAEGIAHDPVRGTFFVGSIRKRKVVAVAPDGSTRDFVAPGAHGLLAPLGMHVDAERRVLWVASYAAPHMEGFTEADKGHAALFKLDVETGRLLARYPRQTPGDHLLNDVAVAPTGDVYVTDSEAGEVLHLRADAPEGDSFETVVPAGEVFYPNGVALSADARTLYVADAVQGLTAVRLDTGARTILGHPRGVSTRDIDGMALQGGSLVAVQNGTGAGRIVRFDLSPDGLQVERVDVREAEHPLFRIPTTGVLAGDAFYVIANAQLRSFDKDGNLWPPERLQPVRVLRVSVRSAP